ncbi:MAG TPA: LysR family transcriptional regulator [Burkholderiaceae bacterium]|nr:LysR family transcriptional regulator [Burkholderiaceae bacterium]
MDLRLIQSFFAVVEHRNLSGAAQALRVSQPTLTRQIQALEAEFGAPLFIRSSRGMTLSDAGAKLQEGLKGLERQFQALRNDVAAALVEPSGEIAFGIPPSPRTLLGVPLIERFARSYPRTRVRVVEETSGELRDLLTSGILDVAITNRDEPLDGITSEPLGREDMLLVGPRAAKLSMAEKTSIQEIADLPLILTTRPNSLRLNVEARLTRAGRQPQVRIEANTLPLMTDLVRAGLGYTILPACGVRQLLKDKTVSASAIADYPITWLAAKPKNRPIGVAAQRFYDVLLEMGHEMRRQGVFRSVGPEAVSNRA